jgi:hypothetical protein
MLPPQSDPHDQESYALLAKTTVEQLAWRGLVVIAVDEHGTARFAGDADIFACVDGLLDLLVRLGMSDAGIERLVSVAKTTVEAASQAE